MSTNQNGKKVGEFLENYAKIRYQMRHPGNPNPSTAEIAVDALSYTAQSLFKLIGSIRK